MPIEEYLRGIKQRYVTLYEVHHLPLPEYQQVRDGLVKSIDYLLSQTENYDPNQRIRLLGVAVAAGVLSEELKFEDPVIYFNFHDVANKIRKVYRGHTKSISTPTLQHKIEKVLQQIKEIEKINQTKPGESDSITLSNLRTALCNVKVSSNGSTYKLWTNSVGVNRMKGYYCVVPFR